MSVSEFQLTKNEKLNELGFLYYNKAVDGMEMNNAAADIINDIRARFGYLLFLKQNGAGESQIAELDGQIFMQMTNLGTVCYESFLRNEIMNGELSEICSLIYSIDEQIRRFEETANSIQQSAPVFENDVVKPAFSVPVNLPTEQEVTASQPAVEMSPDVPEISVPVPNTPSVVEFAAPPVQSVPQAVGFSFVQPATPVVQEEYGATVPLADNNQEEEHIESIRIESVERSIVKKCTCGHENDASSLFCENCGSRLG